MEYHVLQKHIYKHYIKQSDIWFFFKFLNEKMHKQIDKII